MDTTQPEILRRAKDLQDSEAWAEFHQMYGQLLYRYARTHGLTRSDAEEVRDRCLELLARKMPTFEYDAAKGRFKNWLRKIAHRKVVDLWRERWERIAESGELNQPDARPSPEAVWDDHWRREHLRFCVRRVRNAVSQRSLRAFEMLVFEDRTVTEVCQALDMNANQVYKPKSMVLKRVRQKLQALGVEDL